MRRPQAASTSLAAALFALASCSRYEIQDALFDWERGMGYISAGVVAY